MIATHMKCGKKILCWILAAILVLAAVIPLSTLKASAASGITVVKKYLPDNDPAGRSEVGEFLINGEPAFCLQHKKRSPSSGAVSDSESPYSNVNVLKALYYGWGGPGQWSGFNGKESGIVLTSLLLDTYYSNGNHSGATSKGISFNAFKAFVESQPIPKDDILGFSKSSLSVHWDVKKQLQISDEVSIIQNGVSSGGESSLNFNLPSGVTLVSSDGSKQTGSVSVKKGDKFHLEAKANAVNGTYNTGNVGRAWKYQPLIITFPREDGHSTQDVGQLQKFRDPEIKTSLSVKWIDFGSIGLKKINDLQGHLEGDAVLKKTAYLINECFPRKAYRFGGDEFVVLSVDVKEASFIKQVEQSKKYLEQNGISCSVGVSWCYNINDVDELIKEADTKMYENKANFYENEMVGIEN